MKTYRFFISALMMTLVVLSVSCSKQEPIATADASGSLPTYKDAPDLIASRQDYALLDEFPAYPGGDSLFTQYLIGKISYPAQARENHISGKVFASFIVERDGSLSSLEILKGLGYGCDDAVLDALRSMPSWTAGVIDGNKVRVKLVIPVEFRNQ